MTAQETIEDGIRQQLAKQAARLDAAGFNKDDPALQQQVAAEFLTGASQVVRWMIVNEGHSDLSPQVIERALEAIGKERRFLIQ